MADPTYESSFGNEPVAIVGIGCRFPGGARDPETFWKMLCEGVDAVREIPVDRWDWRGYYDAEPGKPGKTYVRSAGLIDGIDQFDPGFFGISRREAPFIDPQQRLLLQVTWEAFEDAGQPLDIGRTSDAGVFVGISTNDYACIQPGPGDTGAVESYAATGGTASIAANRISYCLNFRGPSIAVDTACSSSLVAVHLACRALWSGECTTAAAAGVNCIISPAPFIAFCGMSMLSPDGRCKAFDATANGFVRSEGAGAVLLKPLSKAIADGDSIYALIRSTVVNQDGRTSGMTVPSRESQEMLVREACRNAGVRPQDIQYVESHGTGTAVGDPIEANALGSVLGHGRPSGDVCIIGSVKTNIGHLEAGAGIAGLIKTALSLKNGAIPPNLHFHKPNPEIDFEGLRLRVPRTISVFKDDGLPRFAGVNSFGFGGTNAHAILESPPESAQDTEAVPASALLLALSARNGQDNLMAVARTYRDFLRHSPLREVCRAAAMRRSHHEWRLAIAGETPDEITGRLSAYIEGESPQGVSAGKTENPRNLVFVFSGQGAQWWGMGRELLNAEPVFRAKIDECEAVLRGLGCRWSLIEELTRGESETRLAETEIAQPAISALQIALAALWASWGLRPCAVVGHSVGEVAAAHVAGIYDLATAMRIIYYRGSAMRLAGPGKMIAASLKPDEAAQLVAARGAAATVAAVNAPANVSISGDPGAVEEIFDSLAQRSIFVRYVPVNYAFHSAHMDAVRSELLASLEGLKPKLASLPMYSTVTGAIISGAEMDAGYWWRNVRETVQFAGAIGRLIQDGYNHFVEISATPVLSASIRESLAADAVQGTVVPSLRRQTPERATMLESLGKLHTLGYPVEWRQIYPGEGDFVRLPLYPWQNERFWNESPRSRELRLHPPTHPLLNRHIESADPCWETQLDTRVLDYLPDHRIGRSMIFPASGYVEMAIAAGHQIFGSTPFVIEEVDIVRACVIGTGDDKPSLQWTHYAAESTFFIRSHFAGNAPNWIDHVHGRCRIDSRHTPGERESIDVIRERCRREVQASSFYETVAGAGLSFGPQFRGMRQAWAAEDEAIGRIELNERAANVASLYYLHPAFLDSCFQVIATLPVQGTLLPTRIQRVRFYAKPGRRAWSHVRLKRYVPEKLVEVDISIRGEDGEPLVDIAGFCCQSIGANAGAGTGIPDLLFDVTWVLKPLPEGNPASGNDDLPDTIDLGERLQLMIPSFNETFACRQRFLESEKDINRLCQAYVLRAFAQLGWSPTRGEVVTVSTLMDRMSIQPKYERLLRRLLVQLEQDGLLRSNGAAWKVRRTPPALDSGKAWRDMLFRFPGYVPELSLLERCDLAAALRSERDPLEMIASGGALDTLDHIYAKDLHNHVVAAALEEVFAHRREGRVIRILEVGAGTGALTSVILSKLHASNIEYVFTDVSALFLERAERRFSGYPFVKYRLLDIERSAAGQGFDAHSFDIILASGVLHATANLNETLARVRELLAPGGLLAFTEFEKSPRFCDLTFALTDGWWRFQDFRSDAEYPLLRRDQWHGVLAACGFERIFAVSDTDGKTAAGQITLLAREPASQKPAAGIRCKPRKLSGSWLIFADRSGVGSSLSSLLQEAGADCILVFPGEEFRLSENLAWRGVIHLWSLDAPSSDSLSTATLAESQKFVSDSPLSVTQTLVGAAGEKPQLWLVTRAAQPVGEKLKSVNVSQSPLCGLGRVIMSEHPELRCKLIDLDVNAGPGDAEILFDELTSGDSEDEIAWRGTARYVMRFVHSSSANAPSPQTRLPAESSAFRLELRRPGSLDNLEFHGASRRAPGPGEVEIEIDFAALNFRDVMKALGIYPADSEDALLLGDECSGRISVVGEGVHGFKAGDEVMAIAPGSLASYVTVPAATVMRRPPHLNAEEAATVSVAYVTASYALLHLGRMRQGERVLIHAATGGVGQAAIQLAQQEGAEVFATAGSPEKRAFLRSQGIRHVMDSRKLDFADEVMEATGGRGVDLILNSLAGETIHKSLSILAPHGRFLEIGKRDIYANTRIGLAPFRKNLSYFAIDLSRAMEPSIARELFDDLGRRLRARKLSALPYRVFSFAAAHDAFRYMAEARQIGKIVLSVKNASVRTKRNAPAGEITFSPDATYLITGGLGGLGLSLAQWLVDHGARHLVLTSRSGSTADAQQALARMEDCGARVVAVASDVSIPADVEALLRRITETLPPLRGVFHLAMVLDDGFIVQLDANRFRKVMAPKVDGGWNLHYATRDLSIDHFVMFSSISSIVGNPGQANYAAANAFLDALAHHRRLQGLPALAVNWGPFSESGYVARSRKLEEHFARLGWSMLSPAEALAELGRQMQNGATQKAVLKLDWNRWSENAIRRSKTPRYALLTAPETAGEGQGDNDDSLREAILEAAPEDRKGIVESYLREQIAKVLRMPSSKIDNTRPLNEIGLDSLMSVELLHRIENQLGVTIPTGQLMGGPSVAKLAGVLVGSLTVSEPDAKDGTVFDRDGELDPSIRFTAGAVTAEQIAHPRSILFLGVESFIGPYLLDELLRESHAIIHCVVDAKSSSYPSTDRVVPLPGDISQPRFGLPASKFASLAETIDSVYHAGSQVNHVAVYSQLKAANVSSVQETIRFAAASCLKPIHYVSSLMALLTVDGAQKNSVDEDAGLPRPETLAGGYAQTRWVAETLLVNARKKGLPVNIYRPGVLCGDVRTGAASSEDAVWRFVKTCLDLGRGPVTDVRAQLTPVDFAARALVQISLDPAESSRNFHLANPSHMTYTRLLELVNECGYDIRLIAPETWEEDIVGSTLDRENNPLAAYLLFLPESAIDRLHFSNAMPYLDSSNTARALAAAGIECPPINQELIQTYLNYFVRSGVFPAPAHQQR